MGVKTEIRKVLFVESVSKNFQYDIDKIVEKYANEYLGIFLVYQNDLGSLFILKFKDNDDNAYIIDARKTKPVIGEYLKILEENTVEQIDYYADSTFIEEFLNRHNIKIRRNKI